MYGIHVKDECFAAGCEYYQIRIFAASEQRVSDESGSGQRKAPCAKLTDIVKAGGVEFQCPYFVCCSATVRVLEY